MCGIRWEFLPQELGFGSGMPCRRRLRDWKEAGVWQQSHELLLAERRAGDALGLSCGSVGGSRLRVLKGGDATGSASVDRGKTGSKYHIMVDVHGMPLAATVTGGNRNDVTRRLSLIHAAPTSTRPSPPSAARSSVGDASKSSASLSPQPEPATSASPSGVRR
ncbi:hypothetical protein [Streptomyces sp. NPDC004284]|uniref:hypothetical protein n=1 Tax=Streptomyces sp. NPDC004284 TaxID=3364695 RepID=UPI0036B75B52